MQKRNTGKWLIYIGILTLVWSLCAGCATQTAVTARPSQITQIATIDSLLAGVYDGETDVAELKSYGTLGIGTLERLDGEMLMLDGVVYQVRADGKVYKPQDSERIPFASVVDFKPGKADSIAGRLSYKELLAYLDRQAPNANVMVAVHISGEFSQMHTRSVPAQTKPYRPLAEVTKNQPEFRLGKVSGDLVGFRLPAYVQGINVPGWHLHFITADRKLGGHVLDLEFSAGLVELSEVYDFRMILPRDLEAFASTDLSKDRSQELHAVETVSNQTGE